VQAAGARLGTRGLDALFGPRGRECRSIRCSSLALIREVLARHDSLADFSFATQGLGSGAISLACSPELRTRYLPRVAMSEAIATESAQRMIDRAVQMFGGRGVAHGEVVEHLYRDIRALRKKAIFIQIHSDY
jgi:alkylation response protein AidB-like acyl-CoA dehydrogenase